MEDLKQALAQKAGFEVVQESSTDRQVRYVGRVAPSKVKQWLWVAEQLLIHSDGAPWSLDLSKLYFLRGGKLMYGWRLIIQGENVAQYQAALIAAVSKAPAVQAQLEEVRLYGRGNNDALEHGGRGAQSVLTAVVGPKLNRLRG
jgi:hypothetical protein